MLKKLSLYCFFSGLLMLSIVLYSHSSALLQRAELVLYDLWLPDTPALTDPRIQIVDIDENSLAAVGRWPWPRDQLAQLLEKILEQQPTALGLDVLLPEPGTSAGDQRLNRTLKDPKVITATSFILQQPNARQRDNWPSAESQVKVAHSLNPHSIAHIMPIHDVDGVIRRIPPIICQADICYPAMAVSLLERLTACRINYVKDTNELCISGLCQPLTPALELLIPYQPGTTFPHISAADLLSGRQHILPGSLVLIGSSATGLGDIISTPVAARMPGILVHANIISSWLDNYSLRQATYGQAIHITFWLMGLIGIFVWGIGQSRSRKLMALSLALIPIPIQLTFWFSNTWLDPVPSLITLVWAILSVTGLQLRQSQTSRRELQQAFASYVPPVVLEQLNRSGKNLKQLDAQRAEISVLFADIQGFTSLSEQMNPEQLVQLTNLLFTALTEEIHNYQGTLDKFMGDAVMAFWGAPLPQPNHAELAVACALKMQSRVKQLQPILDRMGLPNIQICIGVESGTAIVGNLGAEQRRAYTALGSAVNTAARIQATASEVNSRILLGPALVARLPATLPTATALQCKLKGIRTPLILSIPGTPPPSNT